MADFIFGKETQLNQLHTTFMLLVLHATCQNIFFGNGCFSIDSKLAVVSCLSLAEQWTTIYAVIDVETGIETIQEYPT